VLINTLRLPFGFAELPTSLRKFPHGYAGPFLLGKQHRSNAFKIQDLPSHWCLNNVLNVDPFNAYMADPARLILPPQPVRSTVQFGDKWEVKVIFNHRQSMISTLEYRVKCISYNPTQELIVILKGTANENLSDYHRWHGQRVYMSMLTG
jgi:hypothetical protein